MSAIPVNDWSVQATLTVEAVTEAAASTAVSTALADIKTALVALDNGTEFNVTEDPEGVYAFDYGDEVNGGFYLEGALTVSTVSEAQAQSNAEAAAAAIATAISGVTPTVTIVLENTPDGYVFNLLQ